MRDNDPQNLQDVTEPIQDPHTGGALFVRAIAQQLADNRPFEGFLEWEWLRADVSVAQMEEGLTMAFAHNPTPSHTSGFDILEAARSRVEDGLPPYGDLWDTDSSI